MTACERYAENCVQWNVTLKRERREGRTFEPISHYFHYVFITKKGGGGEEERVERIIKMCVYSTLRPLKIVHGCLLPGLPSQKKTFIAKFWMQLQVLSFGCSTASTYVISQTALAVV